MNLERSLKVGDRLGGHLVSGHVDGVARLIKRRDEDEWSHFTLLALLGTEVLIRETIREFPDARPGMARQAIGATIHAIRRQPGSPSASILA